jgi:hypothetical protein
MSAELIKLHPDDGSPRAYLGSPYTAAAEVDLVKRRTEAAPDARDQTWFQPVTDEERAQLIAAPKSNGHAEPLQFYTALESAALTSDATTWVVGNGLLALGAITEIDGKIKSAGKTTFALAMVRSILDGADFLGQPTQQAKVVYVTEQSRHTFVDALRLAGLDGRGDELLILYREDIGAVPWPQVVAACRRDGYDVAVFDTIGKLSRIKEENSAGEWAAAMSPVQDLAASGRAVGVLRHDRKGGGEVGDSGRGSSQASGDVDTILAMRRPEGSQPGNRRVIESLSRYRETAEKIVVELVGSEYVLLGTEEGVAAADARSFVVWCLGSEFHMTLGMERKRLEELGLEHDPKVRSWAIRTALTTLELAGTVTKSGAGKAGSPYLYSLQDPESCETQTYSTTQPQDIEPDLQAMALRVWRDDLIDSPVPS